MARTGIRERRRTLRYHNLLVRQMVQMKIKISTLLMEAGVSYNKQRLHNGERATSVPAGSVAFPSMTVADTSCPWILGKVTSGFRPRNEFRSLPQNPTIRTLNEFQALAGYYSRRGI